MSRRPLTALERQSIQQTVDLYSSVVEDLRDVLVNGWPDKSELPDAPILDDWRLSSRHVPNLEGDPVGHPLLDGWTRTSPLHALSVEAGVARTQSRWYRLGEPWKRTVRGGGVLDLDALFAPKECGR